MEVSEPFKVPHRYRVIEPFELNSEGRGGYAIVLRYSRCNLKCPLCYAWKYAWPLNEGNEEVRKYRRRYVKYFSREHLLSAIDNLRKLTLDKGINWVRIQGGEPCLTITRILLTIEVSAKVLRVIHDVGLNNYRSTRLIIQTNGILFSKLSRDGVVRIREYLKKSLVSIPSGRIIFEFSFKDPTGNKYFGNTKLLDLQVRGFNVMLNDVIKPLWSEGLSNVAIYVVAGLGPSIDLHDLSVVPIDPYSLPSEYPLFHPRTWSLKFKVLYREFIEDIVPYYEAYKDFRSNVGSGNGRKVAIEEFEPDRFQLAWIRGYASEYSRFGLRVGKDVPEIPSVLRRLSGDLSKRWLALCKVKGGTDEKCVDVLNTIPTVRDPDKFMELIKEMRNYFYPSHPRHHYPYL